MCGRLAVRGRRRAYPVALVPLQVKGNEAPRAFPRACKRRLRRAVEASPNLAHSLVHKLVISAPQWILLQREQQVPEENLRFPRNSAAYRGEPQKRYTTM